jgi:hypothetical protein
MKIKQGSLVVCLFLFLFVVIGGGLHLNPGGAFLAAATGTPLVIHVFNRRWEGKTVEHDLPCSSSCPGSVRRVAGTHASNPAAFETETVVRH